MKLYIKLIFLLFLISIVFSGCASQSMITNPEADMRCTLEDIAKQDNDKANIARKLPKKIGNMELFNVVDYSKRIIVGPDFGYGIFYDLKNNRKGSGNIFLYKRNKKYVDYGISDDTLTELKVERRDIEKIETDDLAFSIVNFGGLKFHKTSFVTPLDSKNAQYDCYLFITGYNNVYLKVLFYYSVKSEYGEDESELFMNSLVKILNKP